MSEAATPGQELTTQTAPPTPRAAREYRVVENALGIMDTARFEHLGRVATVLAKAGLLPDSLTKAKDDNGKEAWLPYEIVQARAFLIANQADLFGMDPNALAQCVSIVHGKLMYEGKLVHALVSAKLGVDLDYEFGIYDPVTRDIRGHYEVDEDGPIWVGDMPTQPSDQSLGVRVFGTMPGERRRRWIAGSVSMWHKGAKSPWADERAWPRQLRYMGAREWTRANKPSLLLGIMTDDEVDEYELGRQVGAVAAPAPQMLHAGFSDVRPAELLAPEPTPPKRRGKGAAAKPPEPELPPHNPDTGEILGGDDLPETLKGAPEEEQQPGPTETAGAPSAEAEPASSGSPTPASGDSAEETSSPADTETKSDAGDTADEDDDLPAELKTYIDKVDEARAFAEVKAALKEFQLTEFWKKVSNEQANRFRRNTWETMLENFAPEHLPDPAYDASAFRLWVEAQDDPEAIESMLGDLESDGDFTAKPDAFKDQIRGAAKARIKALEP